MTRENTDRSFYYLLLSVLISTISGILFPSIGIYSEPYLLIWLGLLLFFNLIKLDLNDLIYNFIRPRRIVTLSIIKLIIIPVFLFLFLSYLVNPKPTKEIILSIVVLSGVSTGLGTPFVTNFVGGKLPLIVSLIIITSIAVPFTLPTIIYIFFNSYFTIPIIDMIVLLLSALLIPLILGNVMKRYLPRLTKKVEKESSILSIILIFLINFGIFSKYSFYFFSNPLFVVQNIIVSFVLFGFLGFFGYSVGKLIGLDDEEKISSFIAMSYVNNILVVVFSQQFFTTEVAALSAFFNIPYYSGILILKIIIKRKRLSKKI